MKLNHKKLISSAVLTIILSLGFNATFAQSVVTDKAALAKLRAAVEAKPDSIKVHQAYIKAVGTESPELEKQYTLWTKKYPKSAIVPYALGKAYENEEDPKAKPWLLKTVAIDPKFAEAWRGLSIDAERWGEFNAGRDYMAKAAEAAPSDPNYAFYHASSFSNIDETKYRTLSMAVAKRFPDHERGAQALYWLGVRSKNVEDKMKYFELLYKSYAPEKFNWSASGMTSYYDLLLRTQPEKALKLAEEMANNPKSEKEWSNLKAQAKLVNEAKNLLALKKGAEASALLSQIKLPRYFRFNRMLPILKAEASALDGKPDAAYDSLILAFSKNPGVNLKSIINTYGSRLGKDAAQVDADIWKRLDAIARLATPFTLKRYLTPGNTSITDYKGKVVLLTYWFPGCGPCRGEFPHFENVVKKFKGQDLSYVGINIVSSQNDYVIPFMKASGYSFTPLEDVKDRNKGNMDNRGAAPANFLLDREGRVIFSDFRTDGDNEDELELMISTLLARKK